MVWTSLKKMTSFNSNFILALAAPLTISFVSAQSYYKGKALFSCLISMLMIRVRTQETSTYQ